MKTVVRFARLYVYDDSGGGGAILGFCFECTWDIEHGLGVLVRDGRVIKLGENDMCWSGPAAAGLPFALDSDPSMQTSKQKAIAAAKVLEQKTVATIKALGGVVTHDLKNTNEPIARLVKIELRDKPIKDADLTALKPCSNLRELGLASTQITDAGRPQGGRPGHPHGRGLSAGTGGAPEWPQERTETLRTSAEDVR